MIHLITFLKFFIIIDKRSLIDFSKKNLFLDKQLGVMTSVIKIDAFIPYKRAVFTSWKASKMGRYFISPYSCCPENVPDNISIRSISEIGKDHVKFYPHFFSFESLSQKLSSWFPPFSVCTWTIPYLLP